MRVSRALNMIKHRNLSSKGPGKYVPLLGVDGSHMVSWYGTCTLLSTIPCYY